MADSPVSMSRTLLDVLSDLAPATTRTRLRQLLEHGRVQVNGKIVKVAKTEVGPSDRVEILPRAAAAAVAPIPRLPFAIVHEDADLIVIDKPAGLLTSTVPREKRPTALAAVRAWAAVRHPKASVGLIHRLDREASGLLVFSLNREAFASLKQQFFEHTARRVYAAIVDRPLNPPQGTIHSRLVEYVDGTVHATRTSRGEPAVTHYATTATVNGLHLLRVTLETGRKHQIRAHLQQQNSPILGDTLYGGSPASRLMLAAIELELRHPRDGAVRTFQIPLPEPIAARMRPA